MQTNIVHINAPRRNPVKMFSQPELDALMLKALDELVVDVMEERGAIPPRQPWEVKK